MIKVETESFSHKKAINPEGVFQTFGFSGLLFVATFV